MNQMVDLDSLEEIPVSIKDLTIFSSEIDGETRLNAPIPYGEAPEIEYLIDKFLPLGILGMVVATGGSGKTMLLTQLAYCVATGKDFLGMNIREPKKVLYVFAEEPNAEIHRRLDRIREYNSDTSYPENLNRFCGYGEDLRFEGEDGDKKFQQQLEKYISRMEPSLIILDPVAQFNCAQNENDSVQTNKFIRMLRSLTRYNTTIIIAHHTSKFGSKLSDQHSSRGSSALTDGARWVLNLTGYDSDHKWENELDSISEEELWLFKKAEITKVNNFMPEERIIYMKNHEGVFITGDKEDFKLTKQKSDKKSNRVPRRDA